MVPKVAGKGKSFKGAGLYYLHDKKALTAGRVAFTHTENLPTDDAGLGVRYMAFTALRQDELKAESGASTKGRKLRDSVYTYSLSWAPGETPTQQDMIEAGRETLKALGLEGHEVLMVAHNDEPHPHLHLIVNRVHPDTGLAAKLSNDHLALSKWAEGYERRQGKILIERRVKNNAERRQRKAEGRGGFVKHRATGAADYRRMKRAVEKFHAGPALTPDLSKRHRAERQALYEAKEKRIEERRRLLKDHNRPKWAFIFRQQKQELRELDDTRRSAFARILYWIQHRAEIKTRGGLAGAFEAFKGYYGPEFSDAMTARHKADRKALANLVGRQTTEIIAEENEHYRTELDILRHEQAAERKAFREAFADQSRERRPRGQTTRAQTAEQQPEESAAKPMSEEFRERVGKRIRRTRKRGERKRGKGRERED